MPFHIKKPLVLQPSTTLYYEGGNRWSDDYSQRKTYSTKSSADAKLVNTDGKNGGFNGSTVVEE